MCRTQQVIDDTTAQRIVEVAVGCFRERGFAATTLRDIASTARVPVARIYDHYPSKQALLREIVNAGYDALIAQTLAALAEAPDVATAQLEAVVWTHSDFHARHARASFVAQTEWRSLPAEDRERVLAKRRRLHDVFAEVIADGVESGCFAVAEPCAAGRALFTMCAAISSWYDTDAVQSPRQVAQTYCRLAVQMTGARTPDAPVFGRPAPAAVMRAAA